MRKKLKLIDGVYYKKSDGVLLPVTEKNSSRTNSWITLVQITIEYPEFIDKISEILYYKEYNTKAKDYARSILTWLELWKFVSWKQFDSIFRICSSYDLYKKSFVGKNQVFTSYPDIVSIKSGDLSFTYRGYVPKDSAWTDRETDNLYKAIFGHSPVFREEWEEGLVRSYSSDGSRCFTFPTGNEEMFDHIHFGINFKGLTI